MPVHSEGERSSDYGSGDGKEERDLNDYGNQKNESMVVLESDSANLLHSSLLTRGSNARET